MGSAFGQVALVVLEDHRDLVGVDLVGLEVLPHVLVALEVGVEHRLLRVAHEADRVRALQHHAAGGVVEDLPGDGVELDAGLHPADRADLDGQEVEEEGAVRLGGEREHLALVLDGQLLVDPLQVGGLAAEPRAVVDDLGRELLRRVVEEDHAVRGHSTALLRVESTGLLECRLRGVTASRSARRSPCHSSRSSSPSPRPRSRPRPRPPPSPPRSRPPPGRSWPSTSRRARSPWAPSRSP